MSVHDSSEIACDLCRGAWVFGDSRRDVARLARSEGWKIGRRSGSKPRYDLCPDCQKHRTDPDG